MSETEKESGVSDKQIDTSSIADSVVAKLIKERESLRQRVKIQEDAANHWFKEANEEHNRAEKLEAEIAALKAGQKSPNLPLGEPVVFNVNTLAQIAAIRPDLIPLMHGITSAAPKPEEKK